MQAKLTHIKKPKSALLKKVQPARLHWILFGIVCFISYVFFVHADVVETANHSYVLLDAIFKGRFFEFYNDVTLYQVQRQEVHQSLLYYVNGAHYNIITYIIFAVVELPVYAINAAFSLQVNETVLLYLGKLVSTAFFIGSVYLMPKLADELGMSMENGQWVALFTALWPPAFFSVMVMGQYDSLCMFFTLLAILQWLRGKMWRFTLWIGVAAVFKFFPLLLLVPLILLKEKRLLRIAALGLSSLWLLVLTNLLFLGRMGNMPAFNNIMLSRLFDASLPAGYMISLFPLVFALICFVAYIWRPQAGQRKKVGIWLCLAVYAALFLFIEWHPQWIILMAPFVVLTTFMQKNRTPWFYADIALGVGFLLQCAVAFPYALEASLLDFSIVGHLSGKLTTNNPNRMALVQFYEKIPAMLVLPMILFATGLIFHTVMKFPCKDGKILADYFIKENEPTKEKLLPVYLWVVFGLSMAVWLIPTIISWFLNAVYV